MNSPVSIASLPLASALVTKQGELLSANTLFDQLRGVSIGQSAGEDIKKILQPGVKSTLSNLEYFAKSAHAKVPKPFYLTTKNQKRELVSIVVKAQHPHYVLTILPHSEFFEQQYVDAKEKSYKVGQYKFDAINGEYYFSPGLQNIYGLTKPHDELSFHDFLDKHPEEEQLKLYSISNKALAGEQKFSIKSYFIDDAGKRVFVDIKGKVCLDSQGNVIEVNSIVRDVTQEQQLLEKLKLLVMFKNAVNVPVYFLDEQDQKIFPELTIFDSQPEGLFSYVNFSIGQYLLIKEKAREQGQYNATNISFDKYNTIFNLSVTFEPHEHLYIWVVENVTGEYYEQQQHAISNRLTLLGNAFNNVSHDINNVLSIALGSIELLELKVEAGDTKSLEPYIERVKNAIDKGRHVTDRLLAFTRKPSVNMVEFEPDKELEDNRYIFEQLIDDNIKLSIKLAKQSVKIRFPQGEFVNVLLNIVINAQDAILEQNKTGLIEISTEALEGNRYQVSVIDSGVGIQEENLKRIFEPLYSSKTSNSGNGIGLANVYNTLYKHNGAIEVEGQSDLGGAKFSLFFKCIEQLNSSDKTSNVSSDYEQIVDKNILIVDDEISILDFIEICLMAEGAKVKKANSLKTLALAISSFQHLDVLIVDVHMPGCPCEEVVTLVQEKFPNTMVLSISGYVDKEKNNWGYPLLRKPFSFSELKRFVVNHIE